jgi:tRNA (adenine37-N6)-methyltransferase
MDFIMRPIGIIHTPFKEKSQTPIQFSRSTEMGDIQIFSEYETGLDGIDEFSHLILIYAFHAALKSTELVVKPLMDTESHGVFSTRYFSRPNPIGFSVVRFIDRTGPHIHVQCVDMLDETPLLDIKPYIPEFDIVPADKIGWFANRAIK